MCPRSSSYTTDDCHSPRASPHAPPSWHNSQVDSRLGCGERGVQDIEDHPFFSGGATAWREDGTWDGSKPREPTATDSIGSNRWWVQLRAQQLTPPWIPKLSHESDTYYFEPVEPGRTPWGDAGWASDAVEADAGGGSGEVVEGRGERGGEVAPSQAWSARWGAMDASGEVRT